MERRLENRYKKDAAFNQTQAAWRFLNNENCTLVDLSKPLLKAAHELCRDECSESFISNIFGDKGLM